MRVVKIKSFLHSNSSCGVRERERFERQLKTVCKGKGQCTLVQCCHLWAVAAITIIRLPWLGSLQPIAGHFEGVLNPQFISAGIALGTGS